MPDVDEADEARHRSASAQAPEDRPLPHREDMERAVRIMSYLNFTKDFGITYVRGSGLDLNVFVDASYADNEVDRRSTTGLAVTEGLFVHGVLSFIAPETSGAKMKVLEDNKGALALIENPFSSARSKHIDVRFHFIRELFKPGKIAVPTGEQQADMLTKGKYSEAEPLFKQTQAIYEKVLGPEHPHVAQSLNNPAVFLEDQAAIASAGQVGWARPGLVGPCCERHGRCGGICVFHRAATKSCVVVREGDTAGGESSSRPDVDGALVRAVEVPAEGAGRGSRGEYLLLPSRLLYRFVPIKRACRRGHAEAVEFCRLHPSSMEGTQDREMAWRYTTPMSAGAGLETRPERECPRVVPASTAVAVAAFYQEREGGSEHQGAWGTACTLHHQLAGPGNT
ncbi:unnamed protein product [Ectocarpus sp. CCAP 1310/34]|nr:unnamed protein product [Ectocarpus sp. CCAP 1310/34]